MANNTVLAKMAVNIAANTAEFNRSLAASQKQLSSFVGGVKNVGTALGVSFGAFTVYRGLQYGIGVLSDFEKEMSAVRAITDATGKDFDDLRNSALELGSSTLYSAQAVASLQLAYGRLGFTTNEMLKATSATIDLATATGEDLAKSADVAGATIRGFGLQASETRRVADIMAVGFNKTALGLDNFSEAIKYVAPIAAANNVTLEETTALLGTLADAGIRGSMAGTSLRKIISELDNNGKPLNERLAALAKNGYSSADAMDEVGRTAYASLLTLVKYSAKTEELTTATRNANGEIAKMAAVMSENLDSDFKRLTTSFDGLILRFGKTDMIRSFTRELTELFNVIGGNKSGQLSGGVDKIARQIGGQDGFFGSPKLIKAEIENLKQLAFEVNKPIDENSTVAQLSLRYKLSEEQGKRLLAAIREINTAVAKPVSSEGGEQTNAISAVVPTEKQVSKIKELNEELLKTYDITKRLTALSMATVGNSDTSGLTFSGDPTLKWMQDTAKRLKETVVPEVKGAFLDMTYAAQTFAADFATILGEGIGSGFKNFGATILEGVAHFMKQFGRQLIALGVAALALKAFQINPVAAIAAGVALTALAGSIQSTAGAGASAAMSGGGNSVRAADRGTINVNVTGESRISGRDIVTTYRNSSYELSRTGG